MNVIERAIEGVYRRVHDAGGPIRDAEQLALEVAMLVLRGGVAAENVVEADVREWVAEHGRPVREELDRWAAGLGIEAAFATAALGRLQTRQRQKPTET